MKTKNSTEFACNNVQELSPLFVEGNPLEESCLDFDMSKTAASFPFDITELNESLINKTLNNPHSNPQQP